MQQTRRDKCWSNGKGHDAGILLESPLDLALYTPEYIQPDSQAKSFLDGDAAWRRFLAARPLLYLPDRSPVTDEDPIDNRRRLWTRQELQAFGDAVEERTRVQLLVQERTLRRWHQSAIHVQRCFRGMCGRLYVLRLRQELFEHAARLERAMELAREQRKQNKSAVAIQKVYRSHRKLVIRREKAATILQGAMKRFILRLRRWYARFKIQHAARCFLWRQRWQRYRRQVQKMLLAAARQQQLVATTEAFRRVRENTLLQRQVDVWSTRPERMEMLLQTRLRKQKLQTPLPSRVFPPLQGIATCSIPSKSSKKLIRSFTQQQQGLPSIFPSSRGE